MILDIYKVLLNAGWTKGVGQKHNDRMGIKKCFTKKNCYCEIYIESCYFSVHLYGGIFMNGYWPSVVDIMDKKDLEALKNKLKI